MAYTYILRLSDNSYYVGSTDDIEVRLKQHSKGAVFSTRKKLPVSLVFKEHHPTKSEAQKKEYKIKKWKSKKMIERLIELGPIV